MRISDALKQVTDLEVEFAPGVVLKVMYRPSAVTIADLEDVQRKNDIRQVARMVREQVVQWDLEDDYRNIIPLDEPTSPLTITEEGAELPATAFEDPLHKVPISLMVKILLAIQKDQRPGPEA